MADIKKQKAVFLLVPAKGEGPDRRTYFNRAGTAFVNKDGSLNVKLDMFPQLVFNIRDLKPQGESNGNAKVSLTTGEARAQEDISF